uniref:Uncharacterized protein n=1 Tax=Arundo donax TaxID=35708 RepID=A0A0A8ZVY9_ARUDO
MFFGMDLSAACIYQLYHSSDNSYSWLCDQPICGVCFWQYASTRQILSAVLQWLFNSTRF